MVPVHVSSPVLSAALALRSMAVLCSPGLCPKPEYLHEEKERLLSETSLSSQKGRRNQREFGNSPGASSAYFLLVLVEPFLVSILNDTQSWFVLNLN